MRFLTLAFLLCSVALSADKHTTVTLSMNCPCAKARSDAALIVQALSRGDKEAVQGMIERGKALPLRKGTNVRSVGTVQSFTEVHVLSGYYSGEYCWLPEVTLK